MNVLQIAMRLDPAIGGSTASTISNIIAEQRHGVENTIVFAAGAEDDARTRPVVARLAAERVHVKRFGRASRPAAPAAQFGLSRSAAAWLSANIGAFDLVHAHGPWGAPNAFGLALARRYGIPAVVTAREQLTAQDRDSSQTRLRAVAKTAAFSLIPLLADVVIFTSELERGASLATGRLGSRIIPHGVVDDVPAMPRPRPRDGRNGCIVAGFLGRFVEKKNIPLLFDAVAFEPRITLTLAGSGSERIEATLRDAVRRLDIADRVSFLGFISSDQRAEFFSTIDVLVLPSDFENFGMAAAEAMVHGVPVIVSERTGVGEVIRRFGGGATTTYQPAAIAEEILRLGPLARQMRFARGVQRVAREHLSYSAHAREAIALYTDLVARRLDDATDDRRAFAPRA